MRPSFGALRIPVGLDAATGARTPRIPAAVAPPFDGAVIAEPPIAWHPGETRAYEAEITTLGQHPWFAWRAERIRLRVGFEGGDEQTGELPGERAVGDVRCRTIAVTAPSDPGYYTLAYQLVQPYHKRDIGKPLCVSPG